MTSIPIERLTNGTRIYHTGGDFGSFGGFAEVQSVEFNGESYTVTALMIETNGATDWVGETEVTFVVDAGESIAFGGRGEPALRADADISQDELDAQTWALIDQVDRNRGCVSRNVDAEALKAVADAIGVPHLMAAE